MQKIATAIFNKCAAGTSLHTAIGGRIYKNRAPESAVFPYAIFSLVSDIPGNTFQADVQNSYWQFDLFSEANGTTEIENLYDYLKALYDDCTLSVTSANFIRMTRENATLIDEEMTTATGEARIWHYAVDYNIVTVKTS